MNKNDLVMIKAIKKKKKFNKTDILNHKQNNRKKIHLKLTPKSLFNVPKKVLIELHFKIMIGIISIQNRYFFYFLPLSKSFTQI